MGMSLHELVAKLEGTRFYPPLFQAAFGTPEVTSDRIARALAQFIRSMVSYQSKFDQAFGADGQPNFAAKLTAEEVRGAEVFALVRCTGCHASNAQFMNGTAVNNGLDVVASDTGRGGGQFKPSSLRNIAVRAPYMHDGRFTTLAQVVEHYNSGVQNTRFLDRRLMPTNVTPQRLNLAESDKAALVAFLKTLTDSTLLTAARFSNPFGLR